MKRSDRKSIGKSRWDALPVVIVCPARKELIFREPSVVIMNCIREAVKPEKKEYLMTTAFRKKQNPASGCAQCGKCEQHCPQGIPIRKELQNASKELENVTYKLAGKAIRLLKLW